MPDIKVYGIPGSPFLRSVEIGLHEKGVEYDLRAMAPGEHKRPEHLARHPLAGQLWPRAWRKRNGRQAHE